MGGLLDSFVSEPGSLRRKGCIITEESEKGNVYR